MYMKKTHKGVTISSMLLTIGILSGVYSLNSFLNDYSKVVTEVKEEASPTSINDSKVNVSLHK